MTNEEAIKHGKDQLEIFGGEHKAFIELAIEALEKQIPKKPIFNSDMYHFCPTCIDINKTVTYDFLIDRGTEYCRRCGQKMDWSDYDKTKA